MVQRQTLDAFEISEAPRHTGLVSPERGFIFRERHSDIPSGDFLPFDDVPESEFFV